MYDLYPDTWGPAKHDRDNPHGQEAVQRALDLRDNLRDVAGERPDDN